MTEITALDLRHGPRCGRCVRELSAHGDRGLAEIPGFLSATILRREHDEGPAFRIVTEWTSMDAVRAFAGDDVESAVVPEAAQVMMIRFDKRVVHYEVREHVVDDG